MKDYITTKQSTSKYSISNHLSYDNIKPTYQAYLAKFSILVEPKCYRDVAQNTIWIEAMQQEIKALEENDAWEVVDLPKGKNAIGSKWMYKIKYQANR